MSSSSKRAVHRLTAREREVLGYLGEGLSVADIAARLKISIATTRKHKENLMRKLDLHNAAEVVLFAVRYGSR